jgi:hypothetical protein
VNRDGTWAGGPLTDEAFRAFACDVSPWYRRRLRRWVEQHRPLAA